MLSVGYSILAGILTIMSHDASSLLVSPVVSLPNTIHVCVSNPEIRTASSFGSIVDRGTFEELTPSIAVDPTRILNFDRSSSKEQLFDFEIIEGT